MSKDIKQDKPFNQQQQNRTGSKDSNLSKDKSSSGVQQAPNKDQQQKSR